MPATKAFAKRLKRIRKNMGLNQEEFAEKCGISVEALSLWEREQGNATIESLKLIASFTGLDAGDLITTRDISELERQIGVI